MKKLAIAALMAVSTLAAPASAALLDGKTVTIQHDFPTLGALDFGPVDYTVGVSAPANYFNIALVSATDTQLTLDVHCGVGCNWTNSAFNGFILKDAYGVVNPFTGVSINAATAYAGFSLARVTFDANQILVNLNGLEANGLVVLDINGGAVPEPASWAMLVGGMGLVGAAMRRRKVMVSFA